jgi:hypothetical protein
MIKHLTIILLALSFSLSSEAQNDSLKKAALYMDSLVSHTTLIQFNNWLYTHCTAKEFNDYTPFFQFFIREKGAEYLKSQKPIERKNQ